MQRRLIYLLLIVIVGISLLIGAPLLLNVPSAEPPIAQVIGITATLSAPIIPSITPTVTLPQTIIPTATQTQKITPTPQKVPLTATTIQLLRPASTSSVSGSITRLSVPTLQKETLYKLILPTPKAELFVVSWPNDGRNIRWSTKTPESITDLKPLPIDDEGEAEEQNLYSGLLATPDSMALFIYTTSDISDLAITLVQPNSDSQISSYSTQATTSGVYNGDAGASYSALQITSRDTWGANPGAWDGNSSANIDDESRLVWYPVYYGTSRIVVHHTATPPNTSTPAAAVRAIYLYHTYIRDGSGWGDIGYNYLIDQNGVIYQGKLGGEGAMGYHAFGAANKISLSISLIGDFTFSAPPGPQKDSLIRLLGEKSAFYNLTLKYSDGALSKWKDPSYNVFGHRGTYLWYSGSNSWSINATGCPGNELVKLLPTLTTAAESYKQRNFSTLKQVVSDVERSFAAPHQEGVLVVRYNVPENTAPEVIESYLPKFSGITGYTIEGNTVTIPIVSSDVTHPDTGVEYLVPPMAWQGYDEDTPEFSTFTTPLYLNGPEDRAKTLLKIFKLDPRVIAADVNHAYEIPSVPTPTPF